MHSRNCGRRLRGGTAQHVALRVGRLDHPVRRFVSPGRPPDTNRGSVLDRQNARAYFEAIEHERHGGCHGCGDRPTHLRVPRRRTWSPIDIGAMLDVPLRHDNTAVGVLCAEHVGGARPWTVDEQNFMISVANLIAVALVAGAAPERAHPARRRARLGRGLSWTRRTMPSSGSIRRAGSSRGTRKPRRRSDGRATKCWAEISAEVDRAAGVSRGAQRRHAPLPRNRRGPGGESAPRTGCLAPLGARIPGRAHDHFADGASRTASFSVRFSETSPIDANVTPNFAARRSRLKPRRGPRASSWRTSAMSSGRRSNGVLGYAQLLQRDQTLNGAQREALEAIVKCGSQLLELINDVLDLSKIEAGRLDHRRSAHGCFHD